MASDGGELSVARAWRRTVRAVVVTAVFATLGTFGLSDEARSGAAPSFALDSASPTSTLTGTDAGEVLNPAAPPRRRCRPPWLPPFALSTSPRWGWCPATSPRR
jgi:hypothetical protein